MRVNRKKFSVEQFGCVLQFLGFLHRNEPRQWKQQPRTNPLWEGQSSSSCRRGAGAARAPPWWIQLWGNSDLRCLFNSSQGCFPWIYHPSVLMDIPTENWAVVTGRVSWFFCLRHLSFPKNTYRDFLEPPANKPESKSIMKPIFIFFIIFKVLIFSFSFNIYLNGVLAVLAYCTDPLNAVKYGSRSRKLLYKINIMFNTHWKTHKKSVQTDMAFTRGEIQAAFLFTSFCGKMWNPSELAVTEFKPHKFSIEAREKLELAEATQRALMTTKNPVLIFMGLCLELRWDLVH